MSHLNTRATSFTEFPGGSFYLKELLSQILPAAFPQIHARGERFGQREAVGQSRSHRLTEQPTGLSGSEGSDGGGGQ